MLHSYSLAKINLPYNDVRTERRVQTYTAYLILLHFADTKFHQQGGKTLLPAKKVQFAESSFSTNKYLNNTLFFRQCYCTLRRLQYSVSIFYMHWETKEIYVIFIIDIVVVWNPTRCIWGMPVLTGRGVNMLQRAVENGEAVNIRKKKNPPFL